MPMLERREPAGFAHGFDGTARGPSHRPGAAGSSGSGTIIDDLVAGALARAVKTREQNGRKQVEAGHHQIAPQERVIDPLAAAIMR
jgi:hypothetical protein